MIYLDNNQLLQEIYIPRSSVRTDASPEYATKTELENAIENEVIRADAKYATKEELIPYATTGWVESQDYVNSEEMASAITDAITSETARTEETYQKISEMSAYSTTNEVENMIDDAVSGKMDTSAMSAYSTTEQVESMITAATDDMATETWVNNQGFLKEHQSLSAYSTTQEMNQAIDAATAVTTGWVSSQGYLTEHQSLSAYTPTSGFATINGSAITEGGNIVISGGSGSEYSAGTNIDITDNVISVTGITVPTKLSDLDNDEGFITDDALSGKVDTSAMTSYYTSGETDTAINNAVSGKQDTLVNQVNIKSINGTSLLGSGNIQISEGGTYTGGDNIEITAQNVIKVTGITSYTGITSGDVVTALGYTPISGVDLSDYYTSAQTDTAIDNAVSGLASTQYVDNSVSGKADTSEFSAYTPTSGFSTINGSAITEGGNITVEETPYSGGTNIQIEDHVISVTGITVPTKVSDLENDEGFITNEALSGLASETYVNNAVSGKVDSSRVDEIEEVTASALTELDTTKQDTLISGQNIKTVNNQSLLGSGNITIEGGGSYTAGDNIQITENNIINVTGITSYTGITSGDVTTALGYTPISGVDLSDYYTSAQTDSAITNAVSGKADTSRVDEIEEVTASALTELNSKIVELSGNSVTTGTVESMITAATSGFATTSAITDVENHILNFEEQTADALLNLNSRVNDAYSEFDGINEHIDNFEEQTAIALVDLNTMVVDLPTKNWVKGHVSAATSGLASTTYVDNSVSGKADTSAVTAAITAATANLITGDPVTGVMHIEVITQQDYDALVYNDEVDPNTLYIIPENL